MTKTILIPALALSLTGCAFASAAGLTPASAPLLAAVAGEMRAGANAIRAHARGDTMAVQIHCFRIRQLRAGFDGTMGLQLAEEPRADLARSRALTEAVCLQAGVDVAPVE